jgi:hypothetical protein
MDQSIKKAAILSAVSEELDLWLAKEPTLDDGYQYESEFMKTFHKVHHILMSKSLGGISGNRNKKNFIPVLECLK